jgi:hypothetical protein
MRPAYTNNLTVRLRPGRTMEDLVDHVVENALSGVDTTLTHKQLMSAFGLSFKEAALAQERTIGGVLRAARNPGNPPDRDKDPFAWASFQRATAEPSLIGRLFPASPAPAEPHPRARVHPVACRFCGSAEFWNLGLPINFGVDVKTGAHASWVSYIVRCVKCQATFQADETRSPLDRTEELVWRLGRD